MYLDRLLCLFVSQIPFLLEVSQSDSERHASHIANEPIRTHASCLTFLFCPLLHSRLPFIWSPPRVYFYSVTTCFPRCHLQFSLFQVPSLHATENPARSHWQKGHRNSRATPQLSSYTTRSSSALPTPSYLFPTAISHRISHPRPLTHRPLPTHSYPFPTVISHCISHPRSLTHRPLLAHLAPVTRQ